MMGRDAGLCRDYQLGSLPGRLRHARKSISSSPGSFDRVGMQTKNAQFSSTEVVEFNEIIVSLWRD